MKVQVNVEEYHIKMGIPNGDSLCPISIAAGPRIGGHVRTTSDGYIEVYDLVWVLAPYPRGCPERGNYWRQLEGLRLLAQVQLPQEVSDWVKALDSGETVAPISFEVDLPDDHFRRLGL